MASPALQPGLHPLTCDRCGASLAADDADELLTCKQCGQSHLLVTPGRAAAAAPHHAAPHHAAPLPHHAAPASPARSGPPTRLLIGFFVAVAVVAIIGAVVAFRFMGSSGPTAIRISADMPLIPGDRVEMRIDTTSCSPDLLGIEPDGRLLLVSCNAHEPAVYPRDQLTLPLFPADATWRSPEPQDVVLVRTPAGWVRREIVAAEAGRRARVRGIGKEAAGEDTVEIASIALVQKRSQLFEDLRVPLHPAAPVEPGDRVLQLDRNVLQPAKVVSVRADGVVRIEPELPTFGDRTARDAGRESLRVPLLRVHSAASPGDHLLTIGKGFTRWEVVRDGPRGTAVARRVGVASAPEEVIDKAGALRVRGRTN